MTKLPPPPGMDHAPGFVQHPTSRPDGTTKVEYFSLPREEFTQLEGRQGDDFEQLVSSLKTGWIRSGWKLGELVFPDVWTCMTFTAALGAGMTVLREKEDEELGRMAKDN